MGIADARGLMGLDLKKNYAVVAIDIKCEDWCIMLKYSMLSVIITTV